MAQKLLITGFDPFGGEIINPAWEAVKLLPDQIGPSILRKLEIPTVFELASKTVADAADEFCPDVILCIGQAGGRSAITPERIGVNIRDAKISDNAGNQPVGEFCRPKGPAAYFSTLPVQAMAEAICRVQVLGQVSNSAGAFVCNDVLYCLLHRYAGTPVRVGFIHVPYLPQQGSPSLPLADTVRGLEAAISALEDA